MPYKMILNILILFLCTSCCAFGGDCDDDVDIFYLRMFEDGENIISKYDLGGTNSIKPSKIYFTTQENRDINAFIYVRGNYLSVRLNHSDNKIASGAEYKTWIRDKTIGNIFIKVKIKNKNIFECCGSSKIEVFESRTDSVTVTKKPQEEKQPFYEVQF